MRLRIRYFSKLAAVVAVIVAMTTFGFAHRVGAEDIDPDLLAYVQAGGSLEDLCGGLDGTDHIGSQICQACRLVAGAFVPPVNYNCAALLGKRIKTLVFNPVALQSTSEIDLSRAVRAPPAI